MFGRVVVALVVLALLAAPIPAGAAQPSYPHCPAGQAPQFVFGFATLAGALGGAMGQPVECEHANPDNGDSLQQTTTGLAFYRKATNTPTFTTGYEHWALTEAGLVYWTGDSIDPPEDATPVEWAEPSLPPGWVLHVREEEGFSLAMPESWQEAATGGFDIAGTESALRFFVAVDVPVPGSRDPTAVAMISGIPLGEEASLDLVGPMMIGMFERQDGVVKLIKHQRVELGSGPADRLQFQMRRGQADPPLAVDLFLLIHGTDLYMLQFMTVPEKAQQYAPTFEQIAQSFALHEE